MRIIIIGSVRDKKMNKLNYLLNNNNKNDSHQRNNYCAIDEYIEIRKIQLLEIDDDLTKGKHIEWCASNRLIFVLFEKKKKTQNLV